MKTNLKTKVAVATVAIAAGAGGVAVFATNGSAAPPDEMSAILKTMSAYELALNASSTEKVLPLYTDDGIFMPPYSASAIGTAALRKAYGEVFKAITLQVKFTVAEVVEMSPEWAYVRTNSAGTVTVHASGSKSVEANQELFILKKGADQAWRIARYSFSSTNPPK